MARTYKRKKKMKTIGMIVFIATIIGLVVFATPIWQMGTITVEGNLYYSSADIINEAGLSDDMHILQLNKKRSIKQLLNLPYVSQAEISVTYPSTVTITIIERKAIGYVPFSGTYLSIDKSGQVIEQKEGQNIYDLPVIEGLEFDRFVLGQPLEVENEDSVIASIELSTLLEKYNMLDKSIKIDVEDIGRIHLYINSLDVIIGEMKNLDKKIQWLSEISEQYDMGLLDLSNITKGQAVMSPLM